ncbi:hypothetical protein BC828DRAFT_385112 [Blastocladiella britannica]|nr:hypothetical protein BC828DRAFT_385112 [Blastocladiella britannica]
MDRIRRRLVILLVLVTALLPLSTFSTMVPNVARRARKKHAQWRPDPLPPHAHSQLHRRSTTAGTCFENAVPPDLLDTSFNLTLLTQPWGSNTVLNEYLRIILTEKIGIVPSLVDYTAIVAESLAKTGVDHYNDDIWTAIDAGLVTADMENWEEYGLQTHTPLATVNEALVGYLGRTGWYLPTYVTQYNSDYSSYVPLKSAALARLFNSTWAPDMNNIPADLTADELVQLRLATPECTSTAVGFDVAACLHQMLAMTTGLGTVGDIQVPDPQYWYTFCFVVFDVY